MSKSNKQKVIFWTTAIDNLYRGVGNIGGIAIQMGYWSKEFLSNSWKVYSLSQNSKKKVNNITFLKLPDIRFIGIFIEMFLSLYYILAIRPNVIVVRGASRNISYLSLWCKLTGTKLVLFGASNSDFIPGEEILPSNRDKKLYGSGLKRINYIVAQNNEQKELLLSNYGNKKCIVIPNIWPSNCNNRKEKDIDFLWVSNFRGLKRPEWFIKLAKENPQYSFTMIGAANEKILYDKCQEEAKCVPNLSFLGGKSFDEVNLYFARTRCFVCTSTMEGFPNTFLQAWSNNIPVLSTFTPSGLVEKHNLGIIVKDYDDMNNQLNTILEDDYYNKARKSIQEYFTEAHNPKLMYDKLMQMISK